ncbi:MAG TPA: TetR/AcrR family transcriptional regulator [Mycobacteriales bacterium]|nr:TetR/AcrR family transcriptional regulator [Mycobacteriales bacterium]
MTSRASLLDAADRVVQREGPAASMASIAAEAGITKPILYRQFGDKDGLYAALAERHTSALLDTLRAALASGRNPRDRVARTVDAYLAVIEADPQVYRFLMHATEAASAQVQVRSFLRSLAESLAEGIATELGPGVGAVRSHAWAHGLVGMVQAAGEWWLRERPCPREHLVAELVELAFGGYAAAPRGASAG